MIDKNLWYNESSHNVLIADSSIFGSEKSYMTKDENFSKFINWKGSPAQSLIGLGPKQSSLGRF